MHDMFDYLEWRGDLSFRKIGPNPVDFLIFSTLSYIHFDGIVPETPNRKISLREAAVQFFSQKDFETKVRHAQRFLSDGNKVRVVMRFKGREMSHISIGQEIMNKFRESCEELGSVDKAPVLDGRLLSMVISPVKAK